MAPSLNVFSSVPPHSDASIPALTDGRMKGSCVSTPGLDVKIITGEVTAADPQWRTTATHRCLAFCRRDAPRVKNTKYVHTLNSPFSRDFSQRGPPGVIQDLMTEQGEQSGCTACIPRQDVFHRHPQPSRAPLRCSVVFLGEFFLRLLQDRLMR